MQSNFFFNVLDYAFILMLLFSSITAFVKGFTKVVFSTCAWLFSGSLSIFAAKYLHPLMEPYVKNPQLLKASCILVAFVGFLFVFLIITNVLSAKIKTSIFSGADRAAGLLFGLARGVAILFVACIFMIILEIPKNKYQVIDESKITTFIYSICDDLMPWLHKNGFINNFTTAINVHPSQNSGLNILEKIAPKIQYNEKQNKTKNNSQTSRIKSKSSNALVKQPAMRISAPRRQARFMTADEKAEFLRAKRAYEQKVQFDDDREAD